MQNKYRNESLDRSWRDQPASHFSLYFQPCGGLKDLGQGAVLGAHTCCPAGPSPAGFPLVWLQLLNFPFQQAQTAARGWHCSLLHSKRSCSHLCCLHALSQAQGAAHGGGVKQREPCRRAEPSHPLLAWPKSRCSTSEPFQSCL